MNNKVYTTKDALTYGLIIFATYLVVSIGLGEFYIPIKQLIAGGNPDFGSAWDQVDWARRISVALAVAVVLALLKLRRERKKQESSF